MHRFCYVAVATVGFEEGAHKIKTIYGDTLSIFNIFDINIYCQIWCNIDEVD